MIAAKSLTSRIFSLAVRTKGLMGTFILEALSAFPWGKLALK